MCGQVLLVIDGGRLSAGALTLVGSRWLSCWRLWFVGNPRDDDGRHDHEYLHDVRFGQPAWYRPVEDQGQKPNNGDNGGRNGLVICGVHPKFPYAAGSGGLAAL